MIRGHVATYAHSLLQRQRNALGLDRRVESHTDSSTMASEVRYKIDSPRTRRCLHDKGRQSGLITENQLLRNPAERLLHRAHHSG